MAIPPPVMWYKESDYFIYVDPQFIPWFYRKIRYDMEIYCILEYQPFNADRMLNMFASIEEKSRHIIGIQ